MSLYHYGECIVSGAAIFTFMRESTPTHPEPIEPCGKIGKAAIGSILGAVLCSPVLLFPGNDSHTAQMTGVTSESAESVVS